MPKIKRNLVRKQLTSANLKIGDYFEIHDTAGLLVVVEIIERVENGVRCYSFSESTVFCLNTKHKIKRCSNVAISYDIDKTGE